jgi:glycosyltransferase involved in cell wall biosynthesis
MKQNNIKSVVIIPALNEEKSIELVLKSIPIKYRQHIIVADNGSHDRTSEIALLNGAQVIKVAKRGYGSACLAAIEFSKKLDPEIIIFLDADFSVSSPT